MNVHTMEPGEMGVFALGKRVRMVCCDCRLTHFFKFTVVVDSRHGQALVVQGWRDEKSTRALRKKGKKR